MLLQLTYTHLMISESADTVRGPSHHMPSRGPAAPASGHHRWDGAVGCRGGAVHQPGPNGEGKFHKGYLVRGRVPYGEQSVFHES